MDARPAHPRASWRPPLKDAVFTKMIVVPRRVLMSCSGRCVVHHTPHHRPLTRHDCLMADAAKPAALSPLNARSSE